MAHLPEPKDGNRGMKRPVQPVTYKETISRIGDHSINSTLVFVDAEGDIFHQNVAAFYFDLEQVKPIEEINPEE